MVAEIKGPFLGEFLQVTSELHDCGEMRTGELCLEKLVLG